MIALGIERARRLVARLRSGLPMDAAEASAVAELLEVFLRMVDPADQLSAAVIAAEPAGRTFKSVDYVVWFSGLSRRSVVRYAQRLEALEKVGGTLRVDFDKWRASDIGKRRGRELQKAGVNSAA